jgi:PNKP adenylyltransferase domain, ligase domain
MKTLAEFCDADELLHPTAHLVVDTTDAESERAGTAWWSELTKRGGGNGRQAARVPRPRPPRPRSASAQDPRARVPPHHPRPRIHRSRQPRTPARPQPRPASARSQSESSPWSSRRSSASSAANRSPACTSACSACSRSRTNPSTRGCDDFERAGGRGERLIIRGSPRAPFRSDNARCARPLRDVTRDVDARWTKALESWRFHLALPEDARRSGRSSPLRGFAAPGGCGRLFPVRD